ncbi:hypothetical protein AGMMS50225_22280 [Betaproteobacteria bacterium]|nr:hypothetical protein AGMMS50225_22280 [Betaproteobacteria bacterium]
MTDKKHFGILSAEIESPTGEFQLLPASSFRAKDGRPKDARTYVLNEPQATALIAAFNAQANPICWNWKTLPRRAGCSPDAGASSGRR